MQQIRRLGVADSPGVVYALGGDGAVAEVIRGMESPADIGYDSRRRRVPTPLLLQNAVEIHPWP